MSAPIPAPVAAPEPPPARAPMAAPYPAPVRVLASLVVRGAQPLRRRAVQTMSVTRLLGGPIRDGVLLMVARSNEQR